MSDEKTSPAPWHWGVYVGDGSADSFKNAGFLIDADGNRVLDIEREWESCDDSIRAVSDADARIIADAPETKREHGEMLDLLKAMERVGRTLDKVCPWCYHADHDDECRLAELVARIDARNAKR